MPLSTVRLFSIFLLLLTLCSLGSLAQDLEPDSPDLAELQRLESQTEALLRWLEAGTPISKTAGSKSAKGEISSLVLRHLRNAQQRFELQQEDLEHPVPAPRLRQLDRRIQLATARSRPASKLVDGATTGISGTVTAAANGLALDGIEIIAWTANSGGFVTYTDTQGQFSLNIPQDTYFLTARAVGPYRSELYDDLPCPQLNCTFTDGTPVVVSQGSVTAGIDFALDPAGAISGRITDASTGADLFGVTLWLWEETGSWVSSTTTDSSGIYRFSGLGDGPFFLTTLDEGLYRGELYDDLPCANFGCDPTTGNLVTVSAGSTTTGIDFVLQAGSGITGHVREEGTGAPVFALVTASDANGSFVRSEFTDPQGAFALGLDPDSYFISTESFGIFQDELYDNLPCPQGRFCDLTAGTPVTVATGAQAVTTGIDFELAQAGFLSGLVLAEGTGAFLNTTVKVWDHAGEQVEETFSSSFDGEYLAGGLATGSYFVTVDDVDLFTGKLYDDIPCQGGNCDPTLGTEVAVQVSSTTPGIDFTLTQGSGIEGRVTAEADGTPLSFFNVRFWSTTGTLVAQAQTDFDGQYGQVLAPGTYFVTVRDFGRTYVDELWDDLPCTVASCDPTGGTAVEVSADSGTKAITSGIDFALSLSGRINGSVNDDVTGAPLSGFQISVYDAKGDFVTNTFPFPDGTYEIRGLGEATYFLRAFGLGIYQGELYDDIPCPSSSGCEVTMGTPVTLALAATVDGIDFELNGSNGITGTILEQGSGEPIEGISVFVYDEQGDFVGSARSDAAGAYGVGLPAGSYFARTFNFGSYFNKVYDNIPCTPSCSPTTGTLITVSPPSRGRALTSGIDFSLPPAGRIEGRALHAPTESTFELKTVRLWDESGTLIQSFFAFDLFTMGPLVSGTYYLTAEPSNPLLAPALYEGLPCLGGTCDPTQGTPIEVTAGETVEGIEINVPWAEEVVFLDFFESGDLGTWQTSVP